MNRSQAMCRALLQQLGHQGWQRVGIRPLQGDGPLPEVWQLESTWSPQGVHAYLLFDISPWDDTWSHVRAYRQPPESDGNPFWWDGWPIRRRWREDLPLLFAELARIRDDSVPEPLSPPVLPGSDARLRLLRDKLSDRQLRLFACACLRRFWHIMEEERNRLAIEATEQYAEGLIRKREMKKARKAARIPWLTSFDAYEEAVSTLHEAGRVTTVQQQMALDDLLTDIAGNLGNPVLLRPSWLRRNGGIVAVMARAIYAEQSFADLPILADALEEAGCDNADILDHCRRPGEHARGCWVLDLLLGKQ
jgi:hypothetical protein